MTLRRIRPLQALVACQLAVIVAMGVVAAASVDIFSDRGFGDEPAHLAYVQTVAEDHRLPVLGEDKISRQIAALRGGRDPDAGVKPRRASPGSNTRHSSRRSTTSSRLRCSSSRGTGSRG